MSAWYTEPGLAPKWSAASGWESQGPQAGSRHPTGSAGPGFGRASPGRRAGERQDEPGQRALSSAGLPSSRKMRSYWREPSGGLRG